MAASGRKCQGQRPDGSPCAARIVEMHVHVEAARVETICINLFARLAGDLLRYLDDLAVSDRIIRRADAVGADASRV